MQIPIHTLSRAERARLEAGTMSDVQITALFGAIERSHRARVRAYRRVCLFVVILSVALLAMTVATVGPTPAILFTCAVIAALDLVILIAVWYLAIDIFRRQFNAALMKGHPAFASRHQL